MIRFITKSLALVALVGGMSLFTSGQAEAALSMQLNAYNAANVLQGSVTIADGSVVPGAVDVNATVGAITFVGGLSTWTLNVDTGQGSPALANQPHLDLNYVTTNNGGAAGDYLEILLSQTDNVAASGLSEKIGGTNTNTTTSASLFYSGTNTLFARTTLVGGALSSGAGAFALTGGGAIGATPYSLTQLIRITTLGGGQANASGDFEVVPEPATLSLFGLGLAGAAALRRRRQAK